MSIFDGKNNAFTFGVASAAYQIEGGVAEGGRGPSIWDTFSHEIGKTKNGDNGDIACDHFHRWAQDLDLMRDLNIQSYRFSLSWSRLQPTGRGQLNPQGVTFYRNLISGMHERGIRPFVTIYHWDLPQPLQDLGGWPARETALRFEEFVRLLIPALGDLASDWITINEPWCVAYLGHSWGIQAPGIKDDDLAIRVAHHVLLAHGLALKAFRELLPSARVGISNILSNVEPKSQSSDDLAAAGLLDARMNRLFLDPLYLGAYSDSVYLAFEHNGLNREPSVTELVQPGDLEIISAECDFVGINHYHNIVASADASVPDGIRMEQAEPNHQSSWGWPNTPWAIGKILDRVHGEYSKLPIYITENGITLDDYADPNGDVKDADRIDFLAGYIAEVLAATRRQIPVLGYFAWSFTDNFEWAEGFSKRFGLVYVDYPTQRRIPKQSALWYSELIQKHNEKEIPN